MPPAPAPESTNPQVSRLQAFLGGQQAPQPPPPRPPTGTGPPQVCFTQNWKAKKSHSQSQMRNVPPASATSKPELERTSLYLRPASTYKKRVRPQNKNPGWPGKESLYWLLNVPQTILSCVNTPLHPKTGNDHAREAFFLKRVSKVSTFGTFAIENLSLLSCYGLEINRMQNSIEF